MSSRRRHCVSETFEAPLMIIGVGGSLAVVGTVPVVITLSLGVNTSATIIGVGFIGFGVLIIVPGMCWCLVSHIYQYRCPWKHRGDAGAQSLSKSIVEHESLVMSDIELQTVRICGDDAQDLDQDLDHDLDHDLDQDQEHELTSAETANVGLITNCTTSLLKNSGRRPEVNETVILTSYGE